MASRVIAAANRTLRRAATFDASNPVNTMAGKPARGVDPYWADEGARLAEVIVAFVLIVYRRRARTSSGRSTGEARSMLSPFSSSPSMRAFCTSLPSYHECTLLR